VTYDEYVYYRQLPPSRQSGSPPRRTRDHRASRQFRGKRCRESVTTAILNESEIDQLECLETS